MSEDVSAIQELLDENVTLRGEVATQGAGIVGLHTIIGTLQKKLREVEDELSTKKAAARQAEDVAASHGLMTTIIPTEVIQ
ncbi:hypothetical protein [Rhodococcus sp. 1168]|uniref:hypothetical protein n=1 Tax=Rhodococcus sp. 1168 TaxID=2018041 RepID=UPI000A0D9603|nr:hypothetical protein [Rhodococcus sp. 1168]ORI13457.1 hypothetical protein BJI47_22705 [Rhodococcus sp. 1168]